MTTDKKLLTPDDVAEALNVSAMTVRSWLRSGEMKGIKLAGNIWRIRPEDLEAFVAEAESEAAKEVTKTEGRRKGKTMEGAVAASTLKSAKAGKKDLK